MRQRVEEVLEWIGSLVQGWRLALVYGVLVVLLGAWYLFPGGKARPDLQIAGEFYGRPRMSWLNLSAAGVKQSLDSGNPDAWTLMWMRTVWTRWVLRESAPGGFARLMSDFRGAWLGLPSEADWTAMCAGLELAWKESRGIVKRAGVTANPSDWTWYKSGSGWTARFPRPIPTPVLGSRLAVDFAVPQDKLTSQVLSCYWVTTKMSGISAWYYRGGTPRVVGTVPGQPGKVLLSLELDFGTEPVWVHPSTEIKELHFLGDPFPGWTPDRVVVGGEG